MQVQIYTQSLPTACTYIRFPPKLRHEATARLSKSQSMAWDCPEYQGQRSHTDRNKRGNPDGTAKEQLLHVRFADRKRAERG